MAITKDDIKNALKEYGVVTEKVLNRELDKVKKELQGSIANVAFNSPTYDQFSKLEKKVDQLEVRN